MKKRKRSRNQVVRHKNSLIDRSVFHFGEDSWYTPRTTLVPVRCSGITLQRGDVKTPLRTTPGSNWNSVRLDGTISEGVNIIPFRKSVEGRILHSRNRIVIPQEDLPNFIKALQRYVAKKKAKNV